VSVYYVSPSLEAIVGRAVVSERFRAGILNGKRAELIRQLASNRMSHPRYYLSRRAVFPSSPGLLRNSTSPKNLMVAFPQDGCINRVT